MTHVRSPPTLAPAPSSSHPPCPLLPCPLLLPHPIPSSAGDPSPWSSSQPHAQRTPNVHLQRGSELQTHMSTPPPNLPSSQNLHTENTPKGPPAALQNPPIPHLWTPRSSTHALDPSANPVTSHPTAVISAAHLDPTSLFSPAALLCPEPCTSQGHHQAMGPPQSSAANPSPVL